MSVLKSVLVPYEKYQRLINKSEDSQAEIIQGRLQLLKINLLNNTTLALINIYGPNNDDLHFFATVEKTITENSSETMILGGDFNNVLNYELDKLNGNSSTNKKMFLQNK